MPGISCYWVPQYAVANYRAAIYICFMPKRFSQFVQVGKRKFELSNLNKIIFPDDGIIKAELVEYYLTIAPTILSHIKGRPLSLVRYPDGISGESFFQKNKPEWAPVWIESVKLGGETKDYPLANEEAALVWLANLACIELHQMHGRSPHFDKPDYMVIDLDPPDDFPFPRVAELAHDLKEHVETFGYHVFVKTTGRKGVHLVMPVEPRYSFDEVFEAAKDIAKPFVDKFSSVATLHIAKEHRKGRVLIDVYRNRTSQTIVSAYSVRGLPGAPVSTPVTWEELARISHSRELNISNVPERILTSGDPWETISAYAVHLHTERAVSKVDRKKTGPSRTHKTPEQLESYAKKRVFSKTTEPQPEVETGYGNAFVVHRHHASRLHYDLRLEVDGVLKSWAVPKGLPPRPGVKRLAVNVEDHPLEYANFEGHIPKGEYGGGQMWVFARGNYVRTKEKKNGFYFRLHSREISAEYRIHLMKENQWLLERVDNPQIDWLQAPIEPMLADSRDRPMDSDDFIYEVKWDGIRAIISMDDGQLRLRSRNGMELTAQFPELSVPEQAFRASGGVFDGEIVCLDDKGKPVFKDVIHRMQQKTDGAIERARAKNPAVCYVFDCLYLDGRSIMQEPLSRRREWLDDVIKPDTPFRLSSAIREGHELYAAAKQLGLEGVVAKRMSSPYLPGKRSEHWLKIKTRNTLDCHILGYTKGNGDREPYFGALHIGIAEKKRWRYLGKVGTGFDEKAMKEISSNLKSLNKTERLIKEKPVDDNITSWVEPLLSCEVQYASLTKDGMLREPVFIRLRPDK